MKHLNSIQKGIEFIEDNLDKPIPLTTISAHANISHWHFQRIFKALTNETLKSYVRSRRIANSMDSLFDQRLSILDVAIASGFESHEAYTRAFKKLFGYSPSEYRQRAAQPLIIKKARFDHEYLANLNQNLTLEPRLYVSEEKHLIGVKVEVIGIESDKTNIAEKLPKLWQDFIPRLSEINHKIEGTCYGIINVEENDDGEQRLFYTACTEVSKVVQIPKDMTYSTLPPQQYAEFKHHGLTNTEHFNHTISYIYSSWLLRSNMKHTYGPDVETYGPEFKYDSNDSVVYYAVPVEAAS
ncbi:effector binding domain-containing protein [Alteromonas sp. 5E99-2]|uniref:AraC family transcriptional regulator n=1 Tax=Alteromonas sp. 5E99-2 TaxID=2817683 RepID=UPI001A984564|nr:helix-turn-helix domain-containing protein [Alteromonas sp. 5E99-2]MBO1256198.1 effector binding domain-containing protein [Alteromonas sp. 5E99-2]